MDEQTMKDYIEDLLQERASLYNRINSAESQISQLLKDIDKLEEEVGRYRWASFSD